MVNERQLEQMLPLSNTREGYAYRRHVNAHREQQYTMLAQEVSFEVGNFIDAK